MSIADELALLAYTKENLRISLGLSKDVPFSQYASRIPFYLKAGTVFDFANNQYSKDQLPVSLSDISEFIRLSFATEWQNGKLVEVANNIPRISGEGLLVEKSVTEAIPNNSTITSTNTSWVATSIPDAQIGNVFEFVSDGSDSLISTDIPTYPNGNVAPNSNFYYRGILAKKTSTDSFLRVGASHVDASIVVNLKNGSREHRGAYANATKISDINGYYLIELRSNVVSATMRSFFLHASDNRGSGAVLEAPTIGHKVTVALPSFRDTVDFPQSLIKTSGTQVTRAPDVLNIPLLPSQTITGDWDAGVTYSLADGIATFAGHGYIRNIVVEEL